MFIATVTSDTRPPANHAGACNHAYPVTGCLRCSFAYNDPSPCDATTLNRDGSERVPPKFTPPRERGRWWERR